MFTSGKKELWNGNRNLPWENPIDACSRLDRQLGPKVFDLAGDLWPGLMRPRDDRRQFGDVGYFPVWFGGLQTLSPSIRPDDRCGDSDQEDGSDDQTHL